MASRIARDPRIDPRIKAVFGDWPDGAPVPDAPDRATPCSSRGALTPPPRRAWRGSRDLLRQTMDSEANAPSPQA